jgi:CheY-like chemotaxis protein
MHILLVEDHVDTLFVMKRLLESCGHTITTANSVATALSAADANKFNCVISDLGLPDGSGLDLMKQLKARDVTTGIALTGSADDATIQGCLEAGFTKHLSKPVNLSQLKEIIAAVCH